MGDPVVELKASKTFLTNGQFQAAEDPVMWRDFPVKLCPDNFVSFLEIERSHFLRHPFNNIARIANAVQCHNCQVTKIVMNPGFQLSVF